jgi:hypothetical protein
MPSEPVDHSPDTSATTAPTGARPAPAAAPADVSREPATTEPPRSDAPSTTVRSDRDEAQTELDYIKRHTTYRIARRLRQSPLWTLLRWLLTRNRRVVTLQALGRGDRRAQGTEVWLLRVSPNAGEASVPWDFVEPDRSWERTAHRESPRETCLVSRQGRVRLPVDRDPELWLLRHPWSGQVEVSFRGRREIIDLYAPEGGRISVFPARAPMVASGRSTSAAAPDAPNARPAKGGARLTARQAAFIERTRAAQPRAVAVHCPRWLGVTNSTRTLFEHCYEVPPTPAEEPQAYDPDRLDVDAEALLETGVTHFVFSGGDEIHLRLMQRLRAARPAVRCDLLWHGPYWHFVQDYDWRILQMWIDACRSGTCHTFGTVKAGMEQFLESVGVRARHVLNYVPGDVQPPPELPDEPLQLGLWISGASLHKNVHPTLAAVRMIPAARLHAAGLDARAREVIDTFDIPTARLEDRPLPYAALPAAFRRTHLSLYVTFAECCPMLPLESMQAGVPCLIGPTSHLLADDPFLFERLVVPFPDRADVIAEYIRRAACERTEIMAAYARYIPGYNERARQSVDALLD